MSASVRYPTAAGQFYGAGPEGLRADIRKMISDALEEEPSAASGVPARALILPHAGHMFSGPTAVKALLRASKGSWSRVVILAPSHRYHFHGAAFCSHSIYRTPLGDIETDGKSAAEILKASPGNFTALDGAHRDEHSLEVILPLLQMILKDKFTLLPVICGDIDIRTASEAAAALIRLWEPKTLWIASSDFTHYGAAFGYTPFKSNIRENIKKLNTDAVSAILSVDPAAFNAHMKSTRDTICGAAPIKTLLSVLAEARTGGEHIHAELTGLTSSGEITGDWSHCVSYAGIAFASKSA